jgi:cysteine desulfuration protein SufE
MTIDEIIDNFSFLDDWEDRYRYVIELGRGLAPLDEALKTDETKVAGCASQVWLSMTIHFWDEAEPTLTIVGDSDAHIVRGLVAILIALCSGRKATEILNADLPALSERLGLKEHLTPQRSNGFQSLVLRIRAEARTALERARPCLTP